MVKVEEVLMYDEKELISILLGEDIRKNINKLEKNFILGIHKDFNKYVQASMKELSNTFPIKIDNLLDVFHIGSYIKTGGNLLQLITLIKKHKNVYKDRFVQYGYDMEVKVKLLLICDNYFDEVELIVCKLWERIEESDIKFKTLTEITSASIFMHEGECYTYANKATEELTGYTAEELKNMKFWDIMHPDSISKLKANWLAYKNGNLMTPQRYELKIVTKQGKEKWIDVNIGSIMLYGRRIILGIGVNISIRKKMQEDLTASEEQLRTLINAMPDIVCFKDKDGSWLETNNFTIDLFELDKDNYKGKSEREFNIEDDFYREPFDACAQSDIEAMQQGRIVHCEEYVPRRDGTTKVFDIIKVPLYYEDGSSRGITVLGRDITERKGVEWRLRQSEERYRKLVELSPYGIYVGNKGKIIFVNEAGAKLIGAKNCEEVINKNMYEFISFENHDLEMVSNMMHNSGGYEEIKFLEGKFTRKIDGETIHVEISATEFSLKSNDDILIIVRDISERKRAEELKQEVEENTRLLNEAMAYDKLKTEFFANISHELRTPLNVILSTMQLLELIVKEDSIHENKNKIERYIGITKQNCNRLVRLVNNLIDITKIDAGFFQLNFQNEDIVRVVEDITLSVAEYIENKGITLQFDTDVEEKVIACDPQIIERIMLNLLSNAVKFTEVMGNIWVNIHDKGETITISVKDTGIGIYEDKQNLIFERFVQVDKSLSRNHEGSGIGLSLVKSLVEMQGGEVFLISESGKGSEFIVELPCARMDQGNLDSSIYSSVSNIERINVEFSDIYM